MCLYLYLLWTTLYKNYVEMNEILLLWQVGLIANVKLHFLDFVQ